MILLNKPDKNMVLLKKGRKDDLWAKRTSNSEFLQKIIMTDGKISSWRALGAEIKRIDAKSI